MAWFKKRYDDEDEYDDDEEYEDEYEDDEDEYDEDEEADDEEEYEDDEDYDDDDYDDEDDRRNPLKGFVIGLVVLALLMAAIIGLLFVRLRSANNQVAELTSSLEATRTELNTLLSERTSATPTPAPTPEPTVPDTDTVVVDVTPEPVVEVTPEPSPTPVPTPSPTPSSQYIGISTSNTITITTNPQAATVAAGGKATFTAAATNWAWCAWRFISPDGSTEVIFDKPATNASTNGVTTTGGNTTTFTVNNIPKDMDGWKAVCLFVDAGNGMKVTEGGTITVTD